MTGGAGGSLLDYNLQPVNMPFADVFNRLVVVRGEREGGGGIGGGRMTSHRTGCPPPHTLPPDADKTVADNVAHLQAEAASQINLRLCHVQPRLQHGALTLTLTLILRSSPDCSTVLGYNESTGPQRSRHAHLFSHTL
jgi:hypothetical protein